MILTPESETGKEATIGILNEGNFFGESCLAGSLSAASKGCSGTGPRGFAFRPARFAACPCAAHLDDGFSKTHVLPLQPQAL